MIIGNFVNAMAAARAWRLFISNFIFGTPLVWDKTMHDFPSTELLQPARQRLGDILLSWHAVGEAELENALAIQAAEHRPLGEILLEKQLVSDITLTEAISFQQQRTNPSVGANSASTQASKP
jgi:adsorption protein B